MYFAIMAGGRGTRFWPKSTRRRPKQLLNLIGSKSMLRMTLDLIAPLCKPEAIFVATESSIQQSVRSESESLPAENVIVEPVGKSTLPPIGIVALKILKRDPSATLVSIPADQLIEDVKAFRDIMRFAETLTSDVKVLGQSPLIVFGIKPTRPETGYGYIHYGSLIQSDGNFQAFKVRRFVEKPNADRAVNFLKTGRYLWNSGIFMAKAETLIDAVKLYAPDLHDKLMQVDSAVDTPRQAEALAGIYPQIRSLSVEEGIMEKASNALVIPSEMGWDHLADWSSMGSIWPKDVHSNAYKGKFIGVDTKDCIIHAETKPVATIGLDGMVIIETEQAILVCPKERAHEVRSLLEKLSEMEMGEIL